MSIYQMVVKGVLGSGDELRNIHHYEFPGYVPNALELATAVEGLADAHEEILLGAFAQTVTFTAIDARRVDIGDQPTEEIIPGSWPLVGTGLGSQYPPQVSMLLTWKAPTAFPRSTRTYLFPFVVGAGSTTGRVTSTWTDAAATFMSAITELGVLSQPNAQKVAVRYGGDPRVVTASNPVFPSPITAIFATQRSRRYGVGI